MNNIIKGIRCRDCGRNFILKEEDEYIMSYCEGCEKIVVLYKINPAVLFRSKDKKAVFLSSGPGAKCRKCGGIMTLKNKNDYCSIRCVNCGFGIVYKMETHKGIGVFIDRDAFDKTVYWTTGKRQADREARDEQSKK
jgi:DNA-directed RNA polymerase subunit RPC12/RpoP